MQREQQRGRKITLYLVEGTPHGIIKGQIGNWVGQVTFGKVTQLIELASDADIRRPGIYVLSGPDPEDRNPESVYIGESENVWGRLKEHERDETKSHFERVAVITSTDESLTKGHIRYLECKLIRIAHENGRASVANGTIPELPPLPAADRDEMEVFLDHIQLLLPVLGLNFVLPPPKRLHTPQVSSIQSSIESPEFKLVTKHQETGFEAVARAQIINGEFVVLEGSTALVRMEGGYKALKERLIRNQSLVQSDNLYRFTENVPFDSPSAAAAIVRGQNTNGRVYWKLDNGQSYGEWLDARIAAQETKTEIGAL